MYFPSKKDAFYTITIWGVILFIVFIYLFGGEPVGFQLVTYRDPLGYVFGGLSIVVLLWIWFQTGYKVKNGDLLIHSGPLRKRIKIRDITKVKSIKSPMYAPALSLEKLEIFHENNKTTLVSPQNEQAFIEVIKNENTKLEIDAEQKN
ncbi:PH domain-containing protein [Halobacillus sp. GSS1]|uniref:PH domain-containing protein n=1 Tax=Halobacillus sp. GSS1 TaxID=2815919 RepID=UPI001A8D408B|nr:PH domain-containing protein [Halobacillus sp. GSS1]MBN9654056.1 PH domain-containing protein [Halobacillus sp. GSS1]